MGGERDDLIAEVLAALDRGDALAREVRARHPGHETTIDELLQAAVHLDGTLPPHTRDSAWTIAAGEQLGEFTIQAPLARGGQGEVYRALQHSLGNRDVALKVLPAGEYGQATRTRFVREASLLASLHHPSLAEVHGFGEERGLLFFAMRLVEGPTLKRAAVDAHGATQSAHRRRLVEWIAQVADALELVHARGLVHRDVKPSNILLERVSETTQRAVLVDFGLARPLGDATRTATGFGAATLAYAPPEQLLGREVDARADVFALGVTLHDLLTARASDERGQACLGLEPLRSLVPEIDADLEAVVAKATDPEPKWRYADAAELARELHRWLDGQSVAARRPPVRERFARWLRRNPRSIARALAASIAIAAALFVASAFGRWTSAAEQIRAGVVAGDLLAVANGVDALPQALQPLLLRDGELRNAADALASDDAQGSLAKVVERLRRNDTDGALLEAATHMRVHGVGSSALVLRFFENAVRGPAAASDLLRDRTHYARVLAARLFYERPDESPQDSQASRGLREILLEIVRDERSDPHHRLLALSALSGCATAGEVGELVDLATRAATSSEEQRLALSCAERVVRRSHACGGLERLDYARVRMALEPLAAALLAPRVDSARDELRAANGGIRALTVLVRALAFAERSLGRSPRAWSVVASDWRSELEANAPLGQLLLTGRAASGAPGLAEQIAASISLDSSLLPPRLRGWSSVALGGGDLAERWRQALRDAWAHRPEHDELLREFDAGVSDALLERGGVLPAVAPDADTQLDAPALDAGLARVATQRALPDEVARGRAHWCFVHVPYSRAGAAGDVLVRGCDWGPPGRPDDEGVDQFLRLYRFGESEAVFEVDGAVARDGAELDLVLEHLAGGRTYLPFEGAAVIEVRLDGALLATLTVAGADDPRTVERVVPLPSRRIGPGAHRLSLHLGAQSLTTYRLYAAYLRPAE